MSTIAIQRQHLRLIWVVRVVKVDSIRFGVEKDGRRMFPSDRADREG